MQNDSIIKEVWEAKDAIAASCDHNPDKLAAMLNNSPLSKGVKTVDYHHRQKKGSARCARSTGHVPRRRGTAGIRRE